MATAGLVIEMIPLLQTALPPSNLSFLIAAFVVTGVVFIAYALFVFRRRRETRNEIDRLLAETKGEENAGQDKS